VFGQLHIDLHEDPPSARAPSPIVVVKRSADETPERPLRVRVARQRSRSCDQLPREDLGAYFLAENQQIPVRGKVRGAL